MWNPTVCGSRDNAVGCQGPSLMTPLYYRDWPHPTLLLHGERDLYKYLMIGEEPASFRQGDVMMSTHNLSKAVGHRAPVVGFLLDSFIK